MPLFDFRCDTCEKHIEKFLKLDQERTGLRCDCGGSLKRIIVLGHGGIQRVNPVWLDDQVIGCLQDDDAVANRAEKPIEDRNDYNRHLKQHDIVPLH
jgi:putative FmdB family regulatory protein